MAQPILKRRLNPFLLISTIAALSLLAGVAVIAQDQINKKETQISNLQNEKSNLNTQLNSLNTELGNKTVELEQKKDNLTETQKRLRQLENNLTSKNKEIRNLQSQIEQAREASQQSNRLMEMNSSLEKVCYLAESWQSASIAVEECRQWGHNIES